MKAEQHVCASLKVIKGREISCMSPPPVRSIYENGWVCVKEQRATKALHQVHNLSEMTSSRNIGWWQEWGPPLQRHMQIRGQWQICEKGRWLPISFCVTLQMIFFMVFLVRNHIMNGVYCNQPPSAQRMKHTFSLRWLNTPLSVRNYLFSCHSLCFSWTLSISPSLE